MSSASLSSQRARDRILAKIRSQQGQTGRTSDADMAMVRAAIAQPVRGPLPAPIADLTARFTEECVRLATTHTQVALADVPAAVAAYLAQERLPTELVTWSTVADRLAPSVWAAAGLNLAVRPANGMDAVGLTDCFCAIAETGTLLLLGAGATPKSTALLPETHICLVDSTRLVATLEDAFALLRAERGELPRATFLVSGPSRTADIEQTIVIGAHGPYRVHVVLVN